MLQLRSYFNQSKGIYHYPVSYCDMLFFEIGELTTKYIAHIYSRLNNIKAVANSCYLIKNKEEISL